MKSGHCIMVKLLGLLNLMILFCVFDLKANAQPLNTYSLMDMNFNDIDNSDIAENYIQMANEVDYSKSDRCKWMISDELSICGDSFYILLQDFAYDCWYYLCKKPNAEGYPPLVLLCVTSPACDTMQYFEVDEENNQLIVVDHQYTTIGIDTKVDTHRFYVIKRVYSLIDHLKLIDNRYSESEMKDLDVIIQL